MHYSIELKPKAIKDLKKLQPDISRSILIKTKELENDLAGDVKKLTNFTPEYRLRVGDYRILFEIENETVIVYRIVHRREVYRRK